APGGTPSLVRCSHWQRQVESFAADGSSCSLGADEDPRVIGSLRSRIRQLLPEGRSLPDELWAPRHHGLVILVFLHSIVVMAFAFVPVDHAVIGTLAPHAVYDHTAAIHNPLKWALIHALLLGAASVANLLSWRLNEHQSLHDALTGLPNRVLLSDRISHALS